MNERLENVLREILQRNEAIHNLLTELLDKKAASIEAKISCYEDKLKERSIL